MRAKIFIFLTGLIVAAVLFAGCSQNTLQNNQSKSLDGASPIATPTSDLKVETASDDDINFIKFADNASSSLEKQIDAINSEFTPNDFKNYTRLYELRQKYADLASEAQNSILLSENYSLSPQIKSEKGNFAAVLSIMSNSASGMANYIWDPNGATTQKIDYNSFTSQYQDAQERFKRDLSDISNSITNMKKIKGIAINDPKKSIANAKYEDQDFIDFMETSQNEIISWLAETKQNRDGQLYSYYSNQASSLISISDTAIMKSETFELSPDMKKIREKFTKIFTTLKTSGQSMKTASKNRPDDRDDEIDSCIDTTTSQNSDLSKLYRDAKALVK